MKKYISPIFLSAIMFISCSHGSGTRQAEVAQADTQTVADTGYTGIRRYFSGRFLVNEVTLINGIREGKQTTFYPSGKPRQVFMYKKGLKEDTATWFYEEGQVFRKTPFRHDSMDGIQIQYYRTGELRARLKFINGSRMSDLEEFTKEGNKITSYPSITEQITDNYKTNGVYNIVLRLDKPGVPVTFYRGDLTPEGLFMPAQLKKIGGSETEAILKLRKGQTVTGNSLTIIAEISTALGNKHIEVKKISLPYNDLN
ncbi:MAG: hypothetical protein U0T33_05175 [Bacteroidales bacterium]